MLHCPRCSGPLQISPDPDLKSCPAGQNCPHQRLSAHLCPHQRLSPPTVVDRGCCQSNNVGDRCQHHRFSPPLQASSSSTSTSTPILRCPYQKLSLPPSVDRCQHQHCLIQPQLSSNCLSGGGILSEERSQFLLPQSNLLFPHHHPQPVLSSHHCCVHQSSQDVMARIPSVTTTQHFMFQQQQQQPLNNLAASGFSLHQSMFPSSNSLHQLHPQPFFSSSSFQQLPWPSMRPPAPSPAEPSPPLTPTKPFPVSRINEILDRNRSKLDQCLWYYPNLRWNEASDLLMNTSPGTFLVRDSADQHFLFSLSVQRKSDGPTSIRIHFQLGRFRLDAEDSIRHLMPDFSSVVELIDHYSSPKDETGKGSDESGNGNQRSVWIDNIGKLSSPICLRRPLYKKVPSLAHFSRLAVNRRLEENEVGEEERTSGLRLPTTLEKFVEEYPHRV